MPCVKRSVEPVAVMRSPRYATRLSHTWRKHLGGFNAASKLADTRSYGEKATTTIDT